MQLSPRYYPKGHRVQNGLSTVMALPERHKQHENGEEDADDVMEARGGRILHLVKMGETSI